MDFIAIDFETADRQNTAPCSLSVVLVIENEIIGTYSYLINPEIEFSSFNISIHGIKPEDVSGSPIFPIIWDEIGILFEKYPVVAHNAAFDISVLRKVCTRYDILLPPLTYYCTCNLFRHNYDHSFLRKAPNGMKPGGPFFFLV